MMMMMMKWAWPRQLASF